MTRAGGLRHLFTARPAARIVAVLQAVGLVLVIAMPITPGATASMLSDSLRWMTDEAPVGHGG